MPKIKTESLTLRSGAAAIYKQVDLMYSPKHALFYAEVPEEYENMCDMLPNRGSDDGVTSLKIGGNYKRHVVTGATESAMVQSLKLVLNKILAASVDRKDVIVIYFKEGDTFDRDKSANKEHPRISMDFGLLYCTEVSGPGLEPQYERKDSYGHTNRCYLGHRPNDITIILDTPENRLFLEHLYSRLNELIGKIKDLTGDGDKLLSFITSRKQLM